MWELFLYMLHREIGEGMEGGERGVRREEAAW